MTDFVTRLENELHAAALRRERAGVVRRVALPRARLALGDLAMASLAIVLLALALAGAAIMLGSSSQRAAQGDLPAALRGVWRAGQTELRLYPRGAAHCAKLGLSSSTACYTIGSAERPGLRQWRPNGDGTPQLTASKGELSIARDELTLRAAGGGEPGSYRWAVDGRTLRLVKLHDPLGARVAALMPQPFVHVPRSLLRWESAPAPDSSSGPVLGGGVGHSSPSGATGYGWDATAHILTSELYGYSTRYATQWVARAATEPGEPDTIRPPDKWPGARLGIGTTITAEELPAGTRADRWWALVSRRAENGCTRAARTWRRTVDGEPAIVGRYLGCDGAREEWAGFVHRGRGYILRAHGVWSEPTRPNIDVQLKSWLFSE
jgi:hypothetical protein